MSASKVVQRVPATEIREGAGVTVHRTIGTATCRHLDPFLLFDHFASDDPDDYAAGFPDHPHRGFITLTYMLDGHMRHRDSMGNQGELRGGGAQWMKAASGIIHSEMPRQSQGAMRGFQLWINLPAREKMAPPEYQELSPQSIPTVDGGGARVRLLSGRHAGSEGPIADPHTDLFYADIALTPGTCFTAQPGVRRSAFVYCFEGAVWVSGQKVGVRELGVLGEGELLELAADRDGARLLLVAGTPLREPIVQQGPFVMNTREEIEQALADYRSNALVRHRPTGAGGSGSG